MPLARRLALLEWARLRKTWIIEDDYDSEYRYQGKPLPALMGVDDLGVVVSSGSFSKTMRPGLRISYLVVPHNLINEFRRSCASVAPASRSSCSRCSPN